MPLLLLLMPWLELFTLIKLGTMTSAFTAFAYVIATLVLGVSIVRKQGRSTLQRLMQAHAGGRMGPQLLLDDMAVGLAGLLLAFPGLITDFLALVVLLGPLRRRLLSLLLGPADPEPVPDRTREDSLTIEGSYRRVDKD